MIYLNITALEKFILIGLIRNQIRIMNADYSRESTSEEERKIISEEVIKLEDLYDKINKEI